MNKKEKNNKESVKLKVSEALQDDAYKGIARIDLDLMKELNVKRGEFISIKGSRETVVIADRSYPADIGEGIIRMDGILRRNAGVSIGEEVEVKRAQVKEAKKITIAPAQKGIMVQGDSESLKRGLLGRAVIKGDLVVFGGVQRRKDLMSEDFGDFGDIFGNLENLFGGMGFGNLGGGISQIKFSVVSANPNGPVVITENTEIILNSKAVEGGIEKIPSVNYEDIGGLQKEISQVRELVELPLKKPEVFRRLGINAPKGILFTGPPGTGKTLLAKAIATETEAHFIEMNSSEFVSALHGQTEKNMKKIFEDAEKNSPAIIFIDELDSFATKREERGPNEFLNTPVQTLLKLMDGLKSRGEVIVIGATNRVNSIDEALRRPGRFDREIEIGVPNREGRLQILKIHTRGMPLLKSVNLEKIAGLTHGFVGADLEALTKEAAINVLRRHMPKIKLDEENIPEEILKKLVLEQKDFEEALKFIRPSAMREVLVETPNIGWSDIGGLDKIKQDLQEAVEWPMKFPESFKRMGIRPSRGILLYGPPGTGKTLLAKAVAKEAEANFINIKGPSLLSKWINDSHSAVKKIFEKARQVSPCIIFFDEFDSIAGKRMGAGNASGEENDKVLNQMLAEMDGLEQMNDVLVLAATNRPDMLDTALLRPGRFDKILLVNAPTEEGRKNILNIHTKNMPLGKGVDLDLIAKETEGYTGADLEALVREAAMVSLREDIESKEVKKKHFEEAMKKVSPSVTKQSISFYKKIEENFLNKAKSALPTDNGSYLG